MILKPEEIIKMWNQGNSKGFIADKEYRLQQSYNKRNKIKEKASKLKELALLNVEDVLIKFYKEGNKKHE